MRLTLRTLLAYLDDILEPKQTKELGEKISDSHFATSLINRIREVLRRRRLTAPAVNGPGGGLDPNTVAEYLDNTLPAEKVADVEKSCLESDMHLAEVAGCHQILTLVLGEPVDIIPESRERIYALTAPVRAVSLPEADREIAKQSEPAPQSERKRPDPTPFPAPVVEEDDFRKGIPDYLRKPPLWKRMMPYAAVVAVILLAGAPFLLDRDGAEKDDLTPPAIAANLGDGAEQPAESPPPPEQNHEPDPAQPQAADPQVEVVEIIDIAALEPDAEEASDVVVARNDETENIAGDSGEEFPIDAPAPPDNEIELPTDLPEEISKIATLESDEESGVFPPQAPAVDSPDESTTPSAEDAGETELVSSPATGETGPELQPNDDEQVAVVEPEPKRLDPIPEVIRPPVTAQYVSPDGIVLINDPKEEGWRKLAPRSMIHPGDRLAVPEPYNASLRLSEGDTHLTLLPGALNGTSIELADPTEAANFTLKVKRGRLVFRGVSAAKSDDGGPIEIGLAVGNELWQVKFLTPDAVWGLEITPRQPEDFEQDLGDNRFTGALYVLSGTIQFSDGDELKIDKSGLGWIPLTPGQRPKVNAQGDLEEGAPLKIAPNWLKLPKLTRKQLEHGRRFTREFDEKLRIDISVVGAIDHRNPDIATLGVKCFALVENHLRLVDALTQSEYKQVVRRAAADGIRDWLPTDPGNAEKLKQALSKIYHPENAEVVYRLLWGIPKADAQHLESSKELVGWMGHEFLPIRELAYDEVLRLTGKQGASNYRPDATAPNRQKAIHRLMQRIKRNNGLLLRRQ